MARLVRIDRRFRGPPSSGNGGYVAGLLASELGGSGCVVTLKAPPPLEEELRIQHGPAAVSLLAGGRLIAEAERTEVRLEVPDPPDLGAAADAEKRFTGLHDHLFPGCFVCGPEREAGDGLRIFPGALADARGAGGSGVGGTWLPGPGLDDGSGHVRPEYIWAALDCPGYFAVEQAAGAAVLGRLAVAIHRQAPIGDRLLVSGWPIESSGRKHKVGTSLHDADGGLVAAGLATWISISAPDWRG